MLQPVMGHETWFVRDDVGADWGFVTQTTTLTLLAIAVALTLVVRLIARHVWDGVDIPAVSRIAPFLPFVMRMHLGVSLVGLLSLGTFLSPTMPLHWNVVEVLLGAVALVVAILTFAGWHTNLAMWALIIAGPVGALNYGWLDVLQRFDLFGVAAFLLLTGSGRWSADDEAGRAPALTPDRIAKAAWMLRIVIGATLIIVAFNEKLAQPDLALKFLERYPSFNVLDGLGLGTSDLAFTRIAGVIEILFGLLVISGALPQVGVLIIGIPFNLTLFFFGDVELIGHLPIYGTMAVLFVLGCTASHRQLLMELWPWGRDRDATPAPVAVGT